MVIQASDLFVNSVKFFLTASAGAAIVLIINHFYKKFEKYNNLKSDIYALLCKFFFTSSIQSSELVNHKKQIEDRIKKLESIKMKPLDENAISIVQDIAFDADITISVNDLAETLFKMRGMRNFQTGDGAILQSFYLVNKKYCEVIAYFVRFHEMRRSITNDPRHVEALLYHFEKYMPDVLTLIDRRLNFIKQTFDSCDELLKKLGTRELRNWFKYKPRPRPTDLGQVVELNKYKEQ